MLKISANDVITKFSSLLSLSSFSNTKSSFQTNKFRTQNHSTDGRLKSQFSTQFFRLLKPSPVEWQHWRDNWSRAVDISSPTRVKWVSFMRKITKKNVSSSKQQTSKLDGLNVICIKKSNLIPIILRSAVNFASWWLCVKCRQEHRKISTFDPTRTWTWRRSQVSFHRLSFNGFSLNMYDFFQFSAPSDFH